MAEHLHSHRFLYETPEVLVEYCSDCKRRTITKKGKDGRIDNRKFLETHKRDFLQPGGRTSKLFKKVYRKK